jgi:hypothetical protein
MHSLCTVPVAPTPAGVGAGVVLAPKVGTVSRSDAATVPLEHTSHTCASGSVTTAQLGTTSHTCARTSVTAALQEPFPVLVPLDALGAQPDATYVTSIAVLSVLRANIRPAKGTKAATRAPTARPLLVEYQRVVRALQGPTLDAAILTATPARLGLTPAPQLLSASSAMPEPTRTRTTATAASAVVLASTPARELSSVPSALVVSISPARARVAAPSAL